MLPPAMKLLSGLQRTLANNILPRERDKWIRHQLLSLVDVLVEVDKVLEFNRISALSEENAVLKSGIEKILMDLKHVQDQSLNQKWVQLERLTVGDPVHVNMVLLGIAEEIIEDLHRGGAKDKALRSGLSSMRSLLSRVAFYEDEIMTRLDESALVQGTES